MVTHIINSKTQINKGRKAINGKYVEKFSDLYTETEQYTKNGLTAWISKEFAVEMSSTIGEDHKSMEMNTYRYQ